MILHAPPERSHERTYLSRNLAHLRRLHGLSHKRLAEIIRTPVEQLTLLERGDVTTSMRIVRALAEIFNTHPHDLLYTDMVKKR